MSRKRNLSTSSSEAARTTKRVGVTPDHSLDLGTPSCARSSLRGACELLAKRSEPVHPTLYASTPPSMANVATFPLPSLPTLYAEQRELKAQIPEFSPLTHFVAEEQLKCFSEVVPTQQSNYSDVGNRMPTSSTSESKPARTSESHLKWLRRLVATNRFTSNKSNTYIYFSYSYIQLSFTIHTYKGEPPRYHPRGLHN